MSTEDLLLKGVPKSIYRQTKRYALDHDVTTTEVMIEALKMYLNAQAVTTRAKEKIECARCGRFFEEIDEADVCAECRQI